jgi:adenylate cyclase, class 2
VIEAELKARVGAPEALSAALGRLAPGEPSTYRDTYYDMPDGSLSGSGRELRVRVIEAGATRRAILTYKESAADTASQSKPEHETVVASAGVVDVILSALGLVHLVAFEKRCVNYRFATRGRDMLATMVTVPEIDGTFIELETMADEGDLRAALGDVHDVLGELGIADDDLTTDTYTGAVMRARG